MKTIIAARSVHPLSNTSVTPPGRETKTPTTEQTALKARASALGKSSPYGERQLPPATPTAAAGILNPFRMLKRNAWMAPLLLAFQPRPQGVTGAAIPTPGGNSLSSVTSNSLAHPGLESHSAFAGRLMEASRGVDFSNVPSRHDPIDRSDTGALQRRQDRTHAPAPAGQGPDPAFGDFSQDGPTTPGTGKPVPNHNILQPAQMQAWLSTNFPSPTLRVDPKILKDKLFFENSTVAHLSNYKLVEALKYYDPRDVHDALLLATGKDKLGLQSNPELSAFRTVSPNAEQATAIALAYWALSNHYGHLADLSRPQFHPEVGLPVGKTPFPPLLLLEGGSGAAGVEKHGGRAWLNVADNAGSAALAANGYRQLLHSITHDKWRSAAGLGALEQGLEAIGKPGYANSFDETIKDFLTRQWDPAFASPNDAKWNGQANMNAVVAALSRGDAQLRNEDFVDGPTPASSAAGLDILRSAVVGGEDAAMSQVLQTLGQLLESGKVPESANQPTLQSELPRLLAQESPNDPQGRILNAILDAPVEQLQAVLNNGTTMAELGKHLKSEQAYTYASALFNHGLEHSDLIGQRDLLDWFSGGREPDTFSGQFWCCDLPVFAAYKAGLKTKAESRDLHKDVCSGKSFTQPWSDGIVPPIGSIVYYQGSGGFHAAVSLGTKTADGKAEVISIALAVPNDDVHTQRTTIEDLRDHYSKDVITYGVPPGLKTSGEGEGEGGLPLWSKIVIGLGAAALLSAAAYGVHKWRQHRANQADAPAPDGAVAP